MKRVLCVVLALLFCAAFLTACGDDKTEKKSSPAGSQNTGKEGHRIFFRDEYNNKKVSATLSDNEGKTKPAYIEKLSSDDESTLYAVYGDTNKYNRIYFTCDGDDSDELSFNDYISGWCNSFTGIYPFTEGRDDVESVDYTLKNFKFNGEDKVVFICTPDDYDKNSKEKYPVIYMTDGQNLFERTATSYGSWGVYESVRSMEKNSGKSAVIVGISNPSSTRDSELTPDIGDVTSEPETYENGKGKEFSDFVVNTVVPYVEKNYNVATGPENVAVCGSSSGGIESFYIGMEHPEKFGTIGALSPAFVLYDDNTWVKYLMSKKFKDNYPKVYLYCGEANDLESALLPGTKSMPSNLSEIDYPKDKIYEIYCKKAMHNEKFWRYIFPDFLKYFIGNKE